MKESLRALRIQQLAPFSASYVWHKHRYEALFCFLFVCLFVCLFVVVVVVFFFWIVVDFSLLQARLRFSPIVQQPDVDEAIRLMCILLVFLFKETLQKTKNQKPKKNKKKITKQSY